MAEFDLLRQRWLNCAMRDGDQETMGLADLLARAHEVKDFAEPSPLVAFGAFRLLLAIVHWLDPLDTVEQWRARWNVGQFPRSLTDALAEHSEGRFDLFHPQRPFYQVADPAGKHKPVSYLAPDIPTGTNVNHFCHAYDDAQSFCPTCCAKGLIQLPPFCISGGAGLSPSLNGAPVWYMAVTGPSIFHTILLNMPVGETWTSPDSTSSPGDAPAWVTRRPRTAHIGVLEGLTWQPRRVLLLPQEHTEPALCTSCGARRSLSVADMIFAKGRSPKDTRAKSWRDPHTPTKAGTKLNPPRRAPLWRALWEALATEDPDAPVQPPPVVLQLRSLADDQVPGPTPLSVKHVAFWAKKAAPERARSDHIDLPLSALTRTEAREALRAELTVLLDTEKRIQNAITREQLRGQDRKQASKRTRDALSRLLWDFHARAEDHFFHAVAALGQRPPDVRASRDAFRRTLRRLAQEVHARLALAAPHERRWRGAACGEDFRRSIEQTLARRGEEQ